MTMKELSNKVPQVRNSFFFAFVFTFRKYIFFKPILAYTCTVHHPTLFFLIIQFPWQEYVQKIFSHTNITQDELVIVPALSYLQKFGDITKTASKSWVYNYLRCDNHKNMISMRINLNLKICICSYFDNAIRGILVIHGNLSPSFTLQKSVDLKNYFVSSLLHSTITWWYKCYMD